MRFQFTANITPEEARLLDAAFTVFDEIAFATIAMKGAGYVLAHIASDLEAARSSCSTAPSRWQTSAAGSAAAKPSPEEDDRRSRESFRGLY